ncbi:MAG TPA: hypothetical protein VLY24_30460 [Bryobacteraceae bacterium]|nr:hypothetical protein [Bryobacteraceae bacterium]
MRTGLVLALFLALTACNRGNQDINAIRQGVVDHLSGRSLNVANMDIDIPSVQYHGDKADVTVVFKPKGVATAQGMTLRYQMEQSGGRWTVVNTQDSGHSGSVPPGTQNPHGGGGVMPGTGGNPHGAMPSPEDLPPAKQK